MIFDKLPVVLLSTMAAEKTSSTNSLIASYILSHLDEAAGMNITELAQACYVGTGSVSRFVRDIGLDSYAQLKELIHDADFSFASIEPGEPFETRRALLSSHITGSIEKALASISHEKLIRLCQDIHAYEKVSVYGLLKAESAALSLQTDLLMMGKHVRTCAAYKEQIENILKADQDELIIIFSYTGSYFSPHSLRAKEKRLLLPKIWMIAGTGKEPEWFVNETLSFVSEGSRQAHPFLLEAAAALIAEEYASIYQ